ncbi:MAG: PAS domain S-box protein [Bacteroidota bacterium]
MKNKWETTSLISSSGVIALALMGLLGYLPGFRVLGSISKDFIPMAPSTAVSFILLAGILILENKKHITGKIRSVFIFVVSLVALYGLLDIIGYFAGIELNFEKMLMPELGYLKGIPVGLMPVSNGGAFFIAGIIMVFLLTEQQYQGKSYLVRNLPGLLGILLLLTGLVFSLAYVYGTPLLYNVESAIPMALTSALAYILLALAILTAHTEVFPLNSLLKSSTRNYILRFILPLAVLSAIFGGLTVPFSLQIGTINPAFFYAALTILVILLSGLAATQIARFVGMKIDQKQQALQQSEAALRESEAEYQQLFEEIAQGIVYQNTAGEITAANPAAERILGLSKDQMKGRKSIDPRWKAVDKNKAELPGEKHPAMIALKTGKPVDNYIQGIYNPKKSAYVWILITAIPQFHPGSKDPYLVFSSFLDITERKNAEDELYQLKNSLEAKVQKKTKELNERVAELEHFREVTIERELRMEELRKEIESLKKQLNKEQGD